MNDYGIDANGKPIGSDQTTPFGDSGCPQGQKKNDQGNCVPKQGGVSQSADGPGTGGIAGQNKTGGYNPEQFRQRWLSAGITDPNLIQKFLDDNADVTQGITLKGDKVTLPQQYHKYSMVDLIGNSKDPNVGNRSVTFGSYGDGKSSSKKSSGSGGQTIAGGLSAAAAKLAAPAATPYTPQNPVKAFQFQHQGFTPTQPLSPFEFTADYNPSVYEGSVYDRSGTREQTGALIDKMLSETSLNPAVVAQVKEAQKGTIVDGAEQLRQRAIQDASRRGVSSSSALGQIDAGMLGEISKAYRDVDISKATQDRTDQLNAVEASRIFQNDLVNQFLSLEDPRYKAYEADRAREVSQAGENARVQQSDFDRWLASEGLSLSAQSAQASENARAQAEEFSQWAARQGIDLDRLRLNQDESQFQRNLQLLIAKFLAE